MRATRWLVIPTVVVLAACAGSPFRAAPTPRPQHAMVVPFVNRAVDVFPVVGDTLVVSGGGSAQISNAGVVRQDGPDTRFYVEQVGVTKITIDQDGLRMEIYVRSQSKPPHSWAGTPG